METVDDGSMEMEDEEEEVQEEEEMADDSSDDDSENEREEHNALERRVVEIRKELSKMPYVYDFHVELITAIKKLGELDQLRHAREAMHLVYPLSEALWLEWLKDEIKLASTEEDKVRIEQLFKRATKDYLSIEIWMEYIQFSMAGMGEGGLDQMKKIRSVMEDAVCNGGLHAEKGALLWDTYRDFEILRYQSTKGVNEVESAAQIQHITQLFHRQLSIPLLNMESTWSDYNDWLELMKQEPEPHIKAAYEKAKSNLEKISQLEDTLVIAVENTDKAAVYRNYLDLEINDIKNPSRIQALYERIVAELPLFDTFWFDYCRFIDRQFKNVDATMAIFNRAIRNCPWNSSIWSDYIYACERYEKEHGFISGLVEKAFRIGLASAADYKVVWLAFIEYLVRKCKWDDQEQVLRVQEAFNRASEHIIESFGEDGDPESALLQYWAYIEAKKLKNITKARELWKQIMSHGHYTSAQWWLAYIQFERTFGNESDLVRDLFVKAISRVPSTDWPESVVQQWIQFEREEGNFQTMDNARIKCEARMKKVSEEREKQPVVVEDGAKNRKRNKEVDSKQVKASPPAKKTKTANNDGARGPAKAEGNKHTNNTNANKPAVAGPLPVVPKPPADPSRHARTVFISNLDYNFTEDDVRSTMCASGTITDLRLIRDYKQRSKGYCYVEFATEAEARSAIKRDREPLKGRPMYISPSEPDAALKHPAFKFQATLERKKLFVKGLPTTATKEEVEKLFSQFGIIKDTRLVTFRNGMNKGLAYVEYEDEVSASTALKKTDGTNFQDNPAHVLMVALSNPPPRRDNTGLTDKDDVSLGGGNRTRRTQVSFVPNAVLRQTQSSSSSGAASSTAAAPKSNADFRSMLLNKK